MEREASKTAAVRRHAGVAGQRIPRIQRQGRRAVAEIEGNKLRVILVDRATKPLAVELLRSLQVSDPDQDGGDLRIHHQSLLVMCWSVNANDGTRRQNVTDRLAAMAAR